MKCYFCKKDIQITDRIGRQDSCSHCGSDLHICMNCEFYDPSAYNECRESQADRVLEKEKSNFCDYFTLSSVARQSGGMSEAEKSKKNLEELFKK